MRVAIQGHAQLTLSGQPAIYWKKVDISTKGSGKIVHTIGTVSRTPGRAMTTITLDQIVPSGGEQMDYEAILSAGTEVKVAFRETSGVVRKYRCWIDEYARSDGPEEEVSSKITLNGVPG